MSTEVDISEKIREIRFKLGLTQEQFAAKLGVTFPTVNRWENKKTKPSPLAIQKLEKLLSSLEKKKNAPRENLKEANAMMHPFIIRL